MNDRSALLRQVIERILAEHLEFAPPEQDIETFAIRDRESGNFVRERSLRAS